MNKPQNYKVVAQAPFHLTQNGFFKFVERLEALQASDIGGISQYKLSVFSSPSGILQVYLEFSIPTMNVLMNIVDEFWACEGDPGMLMESMAELDVTDQRF